MKKRLTWITLIAFGCSISTVVADELVDSYTPDSINIGGIILANRFIGETFTPSKSGQLSELVIQIGYGALAPDPNYSLVDDNLVRIGIFETENNLPGTQLGEISFDFDTLSHDPGEIVTYNFLNENIYLNADQRYAFLVSYADGYYYDNGARASEVVMFGHFDLENDPWPDETSLLGMNGLASVGEDSVVDYRYGVYIVPEPITLLFLGAGTIITLRKKTV